MAHAGMQCFKHVAKLSQNKEIVLQLLLKLRLTLNNLVFNSVILVEFAGRKQKTNASGIVSTVTFTT